MKTIRDIEYFEGVKVLLRCDFNVPMQYGVITDDFRIRATLPTIDFLIKKGAVVVLMSHSESIDGKNSSLVPIFTYLEKLGVPVTFIKDFKKAHHIIEEGIRAKKVGSGIVFLLENLRFSDGEKNNDPKFSKELASLADIYVNEAFSVSHRAHASIVGIPQFLPSYAGLQFEKEVMHLSKAFNPSHPFLFILGGAKFDTKLPLIERFSKVADAIFLLGALANDGLKAKGYNVGDSKVSDGTVDLSEIVSRPNILLPVDATLADRSVKSVDAITAPDNILDVGSQTLKLVQEHIDNAQFILWNGTLGPCEDGYVEGTEALAHMIAERTQSGKDVTSIVGGGDTVAAIEKLDVVNRITFVSSGGGAMLEFLAKGTLVGIEALKNG